MRQLRDAGDGRSCVLRAMRPRWRFVTRALLLMGICLLPSVAAGAELVYHVSVGSYSNYAYAVEALEEALGGLDGSFTIEEADLPQGLIFRVIGGPYLNREVAESLSQRARELGFESPWVLERQGWSAMSPNTLPGEGTESFLTAPPELRELAPLSGSSLSGSATPPPTREEVEHKLVEEAPPGYDLHRLRRKQ
jgi:hypothetical protein